MTASAQVAPAALQKGSEIPIPCSEILIPCATTGGAGGSRKDEGGARRSPCRQCRHGAPAGCCAHNRPGPRSPQPNSPSPLTHTHTHTSSPSQASRRSTPAPARRRQPARRRALSRGLDRLRDAIAFAVDDSHPTRLRRRDWPERRGRSPTAGASRAACGARCCPSLRGSVSPSGGLCQAATAGPRRRSCRAARRTTADPGPSSGEGRGGVGGRLGAGAMDWEKKTAVREALGGAAADTFNDMTTPGQSLLRSVQDAEVVRKERFGNTMGARMKAAREQLPSLQPRHAVRSDMSVFSSKPAAEVHSLLSNTRRAKVGRRACVHGVHVVQQCTWWHACMGTCACPRGHMRMPTWAHAHAHPGTCACPPGHMRMPTWAHAHAHPG
eukprot:366449-Chlamydomonas_euryale.AAC.20